MRIESLQTRSAWGYKQEQETAYSAVVVNDHMYPRPFIVFHPKGVIEAWKNDIGIDGDTYDHSLHVQLHYRQFLVHSFLLNYHPYPPSFMK